VHRGFKDLNKIKTGNDLKAVRSRQDFNKVVAELEAKVTTRR
jgi:hypothetical protein